MKMTKVFLFAISSATCVLFGCDEPGGTHPLEPLQKAYEYNRAQERCDRARRVTRFAHGATILGSLWYFGLGHGSLSELPEFCGTAAVGLGALCVSELYLKRCLAETEHYKAWSSTQQKL